MKTYYYLIIALLLFSSMTCETENPNVGPEPPFQLEEGQQRVVAANNTFAFNLLRKMNYNVSTSDNYLISPYSLSISLAMAYNGADGETKTKMAEVMNTSGLEIGTINSTYKFLKNAFNELDPTRIVLSTANSIWSNSSYQLSQDYIDINQDYFYSYVRNVDFSDVESAKSTINEWFAETMDYNFTEIVETIPESPVMMAFSGLHYQSIWQHEFDEFHTEDREFHLSNGDSIGVTTMVQKEPYNYYENDRMEVAEIPIGVDGHFNMLVFLPKPGQNVNDIINQMNDEYWTDCINGLSIKHNLQIYLPKFNLTYSRSMKDILQQLGMSNAFESGANFASISSGNVYFTDLIHKTYIEVDENGVEIASAPTLGMSEALALGTQYEFDAFQVKKPFLFAVREKNSGVILYWGKIVNPLNAY